MWFLSLAVAQSVSIREAFSTPHTTRATFTVKSEKGTLFTDASVSGVAPIRCEHTRCIQLRTTPVSFQLRPDGLHVVSGATADRSESLYLPATLTVGDRFRRGGDIPCRIQATQLGADVVAVACTQKMYGDHVLWTRELFHRQYGPLGREEKHTKGEELLRRTHLQSLRVAGTDFYAVREKGRWVRAKAPSTQLPKAELAKWVGSWRGDEPGGAGEQLTIRSDQTFTLSVAAPHFFALASGTWSVSGDGVLFDYPLDPLPGYTIAGGKTKRAPGNATVLTVGGGVFEMAYRDVLQMVGVYTDGHRIAIDPGSPFSFPRRKNAGLEFIEIRFMDSEPERVAVSARQRGRELVLVASPTIRPEGTPRFPTLFLRRRGNKLWADGRRKTPFQRVAR